MKTPESLLIDVRSKKPVVHHITNWVTIYDCANVVKVFGASPVMAHAQDEAADMANIAQAVVLNIGTLTNDIIESMKLAAKKANQKNIPVVLDVCGAGATAFRNRKSLELINECRIDIIKGNASEIAFIAGENVRTKGVDSTDVKKDLEVIARSLASEKKCVVVITGENDIVADENRLAKISNGHPIMASIVGTGCMAASCIGTFAAVTSDYFEGAVAGLVCYETAAELAAEKSIRPGSFKEELFDQIYNLTSENVSNMQKISISSVSKA